MNDWEASGESGDILPPDFVEWLKSLHVNWVGLSVALYFEDSLDSTVERAPGGGEEIPESFSDQAIRQLAREFRSHGMDLYLTLAFEGVERRFSTGNPWTPDGVSPERWPWRPDHPDHDRFVAEFWDTYTQEAVRVARIAQEAGVRLFSLGTETDNLFRTRSGGDWPNHYGEELKQMVRSVREVYGGLLTYDMHYSAITARDHYGPGSDHLWTDLDLDVVGVSAYFPLTESLPSTVVSIDTLQASYERIFRDHLVPLAERNPGRPIFFTEYGAPDVVKAPFEPEGSYDPFVFADQNQNGIDDGHETQANIYQALFDTMNRHPGVLEGVFLWDNWIASDEMWESDFAHLRSFSIRDKPAEEVVRSVYEKWDVHPMSSSAR